MEQKRSGKKSKPRGAGTYWARVYCRCAGHGSHDVIFSAGDDDSWVVAQWLAQTLREYERETVRCLIWHTREKWVPTPLDQIEADQIEDDIPF